VYQIDAGARELAHKLIFPRRSAGPSWARKEKERRGEQRDEPPGQRREQVQWLGAGIGIGIGIGIGEEKNRRGRRRRSEKGKRNWH